MKNLIKHIAVLLMFFALFPSYSSAGNKILPAPKPSIDKKTKEIFSKKKEIYPKKKPLHKKSEAQTDLNKQTVEKTEVAKKVFIVPKEKPLVVKKKISKKIKISEILSKKDFKIAKSAFKNIKQRKWNKALKISKKAKDKSIYKLVNYLYLKEPNNGASFYDYASFINSNPSFPRIGRIRYLAEHKINLNVQSRKTIIKWFNGNEPLSDFGKIKLGEVYIASKDYEKGSALIKEGWTKAKLRKADLKYLRKKYKKIITVEDNIKRADWHAWEGKHWDVKRMLRYLPKDYTALYDARQILMSQSYGVDTAIAKVPNKFKNDIGLKYDRLKWRRRRGRLESSLEIIFEAPSEPLRLVRPDKWWVERSILTRSLIYKQKYVLAYKVSNNHSLKEGPQFAEAEWLSGWIALTFLDDPNMALSHFKRFYDNVGYPISLSRGAYWLGQTYNKINNKKKSDEWFKEASKYLNTYYGQLAFEKIRPNEPYTLPKQKIVSKKYEKKFKENSLIRIVKLLDELNKDKYAKDFIKHLALLNIDEGSEILAGRLAVEIGRYDYAIQIAKQASYEKRFYNLINYPVLETPEVVNQKRMPKPELVLAVIRQESEFDSKANSSVGARGLMQLMTYTARLVAKQAKLPYSKNRLKSDANYNIKLGSYYLTTLLEMYEGSYPFALAAYNAGPKRVKHWNKINGNPQKGKISYVDWIELIKFKETRNYVQRVLENVNVYKYLLSGKPTKIYNFFEDKVHY